MGDNVKIGITAGSFDLLHAGHVLMLKECKEVCDFLVVLLQTDPTADRPFKNKPIQTVEERRIQLDGCRYVDHVYTYTTEAELYEMLSTMDYDVRILGEEYKGSQFTGHDIPGHVAKCYFNSRDHNYSSSSLRERVFREESRKNRQRK